MFIDEPLLYTEYMTIIDISLPIHPSMPIYPGNEPTRFEKIVKPSGSQLTTMTFDTHAGTHIDAPTHAGLEGSIDAFPLEAFYGPVRVIEILETELITAEQLKPHAIHAEERILLKTDNSLRGHDTFHETWTALSSEAADYLAKQGVALVGIDWFGIKQKGAPDNGAHTALLSQQIPILEGITLADVTPGEYTLSAFPVAYIGVDGAQTRAVLIG